MRAERALSVRHCCTIVDLSSRSESDSPHTNTCRAGSGRDDFSSSTVQHGQVQALNTIGELTSAFALLLSQQQAVAAL